MLLITIIVQQNFKNKSITGCEKNTKQKQKPAVLLIESYSNNEVVLIIGWSLSKVLLHIIFWLCTNLEL